MLKKVPLFAGLDEDEVAGRIGTTMSPSEYPELARTLEHPRSAVIDRDNASPLPR
mgnify:CR=1 FL=1